MARRPRIRILVYVYDDKPSENVDGPSGFTSDRAIIEVAESVNDRAIGEWRLWKVGKAPDGLRLIRTLHALGLEKYPYSRLWSPMVTAAMQWAEMTLPERSTAVHDYRTVGARVIRQRKPTPAARVVTLQRAIERAPEGTEVLGVRGDGSVVSVEIPATAPSLTYAPVRGDYSPLPDPS